LQPNTSYIQFLMTLIDDYELVRASLLHQNPFSSLEDVLPRLKYEETRLRLTLYKSETVFAGIDRKGKFCCNYNRSGYLFSDCLSIECQKSKQKCHIGSNCPKLFCHYCKLLEHLITTSPTRSPRSDQNKYQSRPNYSKNVFASITVVVTKSINSASLNPLSVSPSHIESLLKKFLSFSNNTLAALFTSPSNCKWYFDSGCFNHMFHFCHLFSSLSTTTNVPSINNADGFLLHATHKGFISQSNFNFLILILFLFQN